MLYVPVRALVSAMILSRTALGLSPGEFFHLLNAGDVGRGAMTAVVLGMGGALVHGHRGVSVASVSHGYEIHRLPPPLLRSVRGLREREGRC